MQILIRALPQTTNWSAEPMGRCHHPHATAWPGPIESELQAKLDAARMLLYEDRDPRLEDLVARGDAEFQSRCHK
jgi:hypothetical protein